MESSRRKIVVIDDEKDFCSLLKGYFEKHNFQVSATSHLTDAKKLIEDIQPEFIFIDNNLPDGSGWIAGMEWLKDYPETHFIFVSAYNTNLPYLPIDGRAEVIEKPIALAQLKHLLDDATVKIYE